MLRPPPHSIHSPELEAALSGPFTAEFSAPPSDAVLVRREERRVAWRLRRSGRSRLLFVESALGAPPPGRAERIEVRDRIASDRDTILFSDAGHRYFIGTRVRRLESGYAVYEEFPLPEKTALPGRSAKAGARASRAGHGQLGGRNRVTAALARALMPPLDPDPADPTGEIDRLLREMAEPARVRTALDVLDRIVVVDRRADRADWLIGAAESLEWVRASALACARGIVADAAIARSGRRPEYLSDLRQAVDLFDERLNDHPGLCPVRQRIAQRSIFGFARDEASAARLRRQIEDWVGFAPGEAVGIDTNIAIRGRGDGDEPGANGLATTGVHRDETDAALDLAAAWILAADERLRPNPATTAEWRTATSALALRGTELRSSLPTALSRWFPILDGRQRPIIIERGPGHG